MTIAIYLAGSIQKGHEKIDESYWTENDKEHLQKALHPLRVSFLNPAHRTDNLSDQHAVFGRDMLQVACSDIVFVDARDRRGLGVGAEMMWAKVRRIPVLVWAPHNSHYRKDETTLLGVPVFGWVHPFVESLSDGIVPDLDQGARWIHQWKTNPNLKIKGTEWIESAMRHYQNTQLPQDFPMLELLQSSDHVHKRSLALNHSK